MEEITVSKPNDLTGRVFGRLTVIERAPNNKKGGTMWRCRCSCGKELVTYSYTLTGGNSTSCGCKRSESLVKVNVETKTTHHETKTRLYRIWRGMRSRCNNPSDAAYKHYGGRGITVCPEWNKSYETFRNWALSHGYSPDLSIDRIDNDGNYEPSNCHWATQSEQNANRRAYKWKRNR